MRARYIATTLLNHSIRHSRPRHVASKPWFVDDEPEITTVLPSKPQIVPEAPKGTPQHIARAFALLAQSPLIDPATVTVGSPVPADAQPDGDFPLPILKKVQKARGKRKERGYGKGVGEGPGQGVYQWEVIGQVKEGAEARGAIDLVANSLRNTLKNEFPYLTVPSRSHHKNQTDGWALIDLGTTAVHICSRRAWLRWMDPTREW